MLKNSTNNGVSEIERIRWERERIILCLRNGIRYLAYITGYKRLDPGQSFTYRNGIRYLALVWLDGSTDLNCLKINTKLSFTRTTITSKSPSEAVFILLEVLLKPGSPYSFGGTPKARQPLLDRSSQNSQLVCIKST